MLSYLLDFLIVLVLPATMMALLAYLADHQPDRVLTQFVAVLVVISLFLAVLRVSSWLISGERLT